MAAIRRQSARRCISKHALAVVCFNCLAALAGCWQEIRYDPSQEPVSIRPQPTVHPAETRRPTSIDNSAAAAGTALKTPTAQELFAEDSNGDSAVSNTRAERDETEPPPLGSLLDAQATTPKRPEPAPPAELDLTVDTGTQTSAAPLKMAWQLGSKWSLAIGIYGKGFGEQRYANVWQQAAEAAEVLGVRLPPVPTSEEDRLPTAIGVLLQSDGPELVELVGAAHSAQHQASCNLAIRTHALLLTYRRVGEDLDSQAESIRRLGENSGVPAHLWQPVVQAITDRAEFQDLKRAVLELQAQAAEALDQATVP